jgi:hypothetical protein
MSDNHPFHDPLPGGSSPSWQQDVFQHPADWASGGMSARPQRLSLTALFSVIAGGLGWATCCCGFLMLPLTMTSVGLGHVALLQISRSQGQLSGKPLAIIGLVIGYCGMVLSIGMIVLSFSGQFEQFKKGRDNDAPPTTAKAALERIESNILSDRNGIGQGNTDEAAALATRFSERMQALRELHFTKGRNRISVSGGKFITWCESRPGQCAFVVHVPNYRNFEGDAQEQLAALAWQAAQETVAGTLAEEDRLAVGLKGVILYGSVMTGTVVSPELAEAGLDKQTSDKELLLPFVEPLPDEDFEAEPQEPFEQNDPAVDAGDPDDEPQQKFGDPGR